MVRKRIDLRRQATDYRGGTTDYRPVLARSQAFSLRPHASLRGMTLIELLVVIVILMMVTAIAIPVLAPNVEQKRIREGARLVSGFIDGARTKAQATGSPYGVLFERLPSNPNACMTLSYVYVPPSYSGESMGSVCKVYYEGGVLKMNIDPKGTGDFDHNLLRRGDLVRINHQGHLYKIDAPATITASDKVLTIVLVNPAVALPWKTSTDNGLTDTAGNPLATYPYTIIRQPIKAPGTPLQLPEGAVIDLSVSGPGLDGLLTTSLPATPTNLTPLTVENTDSIAVIFGGNGAVTSVMIGGTASPVSGNLNFLIGRPDGVNTTSTPVVAPTVPNLADLNSLWISISTQAGMVSTAENAAYQGANAPLNDARAIAAGLQSMGGR